VVAIGDQKCDFCSNPDVRWSFPAGDFTVKIENEVTGDTGLPEDKSADVAYVKDAWLACDDCKNLYEEGGIAALVERVGSLYKLVDPTLADPRLYEKVTEALTRLYTAFQVNRTGLPVPIERQEGD